ncbi:MAG: hypothetical protein LIO46_03690, partial [Clostridiales bacterium]|nr:hypothetical protein [Clostridiales bacterium]
TFTRRIAFSGSGCGSCFSSVTTTSATTYAYRFRSIMTLTLYDSDGNVLETVNHTSIVTSRKDFTQTEFDALIGEAVML